MSQPPNFGMSGLPPIFLGNVEMEGLGRFHPLHPPQRLPNRPTINTKSASDIRLVHTQLLEVLGFRSDLLIDRSRFDLENRDLDGHGGPGSNSSRPRPPKTSYSPPFQAAFLVSDS